MVKIKYFPLLIAATVFYLALSYFSGARLNDMVLFVSILWILPLSLRFGNEMLQGRAKTLKAEENRKRNSLGHVYARLEELKRERAYLEHKLADLSKLYTISKNMSRDISFDTAFVSMENFLVDSFKFKTMRIVLFEEGSDGEVIESIYEVCGQTKGYIKKTKMLENLVGRISQSKKPIFFKEKEELLNLGTELGVKNLLALPLIVRKKIIALLTIENVEEEDYDKFLILVPQLALQIERIRLFEDVKRLSTVDGLTGVFLRRYFMIRLSEEVLRAQESQRPLSFVMVDLDHFKECNDTFGHLVGDVVLKEVASILKKNVREIDLIGRYGGEEFCILLPEADKKSALGVAERIRHIVETHTIKAYDESLRMTLSMGISTFPEDAKVAEKLPEKADHALYKAKVTGRNKICLAE